MNRRRLSKLLGIAVLASVATLFGAASHASERCAVVIGNSAYQSLPEVKRATENADVVASALEARGFEVSKIENATGAAMAEAFDRACASAGPSSIVFAYYAGQGMAADGQSYMIPVNAVPSETGELAAVSLFASVNALSDGKTRTVVFSFDAPRGRRIAGLDRDFHPVSAGRIEDPEGEMIISWATQPGGLVEDADSGAYASALAEALRAPDAAVPGIFDAVRDKVEQATMGRQSTWMAASLPASVALGKP